MASPYDLQEQEQLAQIKHFWARYGNLITWLLIAVLGGYAAWNGWQYWQRKTALEAATLYDELDRAARANDVDRVRRVWSDMQKQAGRSAQAQQAGLLAARVLHDAGAADESREALKVVVNRAADPGVVAVARLRLAGLELEAGDHAAALKWLEASFPAEYAALVADRRGDVLLAQGQAEAARQAYQSAWRAMSPEVDYRRIVEAKLNALGVDPTRASE
ncbi:YfgM family protein [Tepidicella baoligensis]|uniref:YfgM family protein n=1 Tax=Tepidicella baoligensis TaxID=2707016 RepID=UPI0015DA9CCF|nr:tetratricopeptide repeat protein [Tepidicella baoligensis]